MQNRLENFHDFLEFQSSYWFECGCPACVNNWPCFMKLPRDYLKLSGANFRYKRCNRKELQKDVDKMRKRIRKIILDETVPASMTTAVDGAGPANHFEAARRLFHDWMNLLDELLIPPGHQVIFLDIYTLVMYYSITI